MQVFITFCHCLPIIKPSDVFSTNIWPYEHSEEQKNIATYVDLVGMFSEIHDSRPFL